ncbi:50S ribosomal protein L7/L12 [Patescibacteria group bacterium]|nr:50S ribosomal protein L7/L12 [Patescibacteria group bacterium]MBU1123179.1 50S ribosomal protein L7/L12 [Patescibacteria group bacterium]
MADDTATADKVSLAKEEKAVIDALEKLNVVQLNNVVKFMEQEYGISAAAPMAVAAPAAGAGGGDAGDEEEKSNYDIELTGAGEQKIAVIKVVREITGLPLGEAKAAVDGAPKVIKEGVPKEEAEKIKAQLEGAGATVTLK